MNPHYACWFDDERQPRTRDRARLTFADLRVLARPGHAPCPADPAQWLAWAKGEPTTGPRRVRILDVELAARVEAARAQRAMPTPAPGLSPWVPDDRGFARYQLGPEGGRGRRVALVRYAGPARWGRDGGPSGERWRAVAGSSWGYDFPSREAAQAWCDEALAGARRAA